MDSTDGMRIETAVVLSLCNLSRGQLRSMAAVTFKTITSNNLPRHREGHRRPFWEGSSGLLADVTSLNCFRSQRSFAPIHDISSRARCMAVISFFIEVMRVKASSCWGNLELLSVRCRRGSRTMLSCGRNLERKVTTPISRWSPWTSNWTKMDLRQTCSAQMWLKLCKIRNKSVQRW